MPKATPKNLSSGPDDPALAAGLRLLARRRWTEAGMDSRLREKFGEEAAASAVVRLRSWGHLDDTEFCRDFIERRALKDCYGRERVLQELIGRGVSEGLAIAVLSEVLPEETERAACASALQKFLLRRGVAADALAEPREPGAECLDSDSREERLRAAACRHLLARGFSADTVCDLLGVTV